MGAQTARITNSPSTAIKKAEFTVVVDRDTRLGEMQVDLRGKGSYLKQGSAWQPGHPQADGPGRLLPADHHSV